MFLYFQEGKAIVYTIAFNTINSIDKPVKIKFSVNNFTHDNAVNGVKLIRLGHTEAIGDNAAIPAFKNTDNPTAIKKLLQLQIASTPYDVGYPISIVQFTPTNIKWIELGLCNSSTK